MPSKPNAPKPPQKPTTGHKMDREMNTPQPAGPWAKRIYVS